MVKQCEDWMSSKKRSKWSTVHNTASVLNEMSYMVGRDSYIVKDHDVGELLSNRSYKISKARSVGHVMKNRNK